MTTIAPAPRLYWEEALHRAGARDAALSEDAIEAVAFTTDDGPPDRTLLD